VAGESENRQNRIEELFGDASELPAGQREAFLASACGDDVELLSVLQDLLRYHDPQGKFLPTIPPPKDPAPDTVPTTPPGEIAPENLPAEGVGSVIGRYRLLEKVGEGTFGTVYRAEQSEPVRRMVAMKRLNPGMNSKQVLARFEAERQALAILDHPNIARIFDAGQTPNGYPYFVMELVRGVRITDYCDAHRLDLEQRLELFVQLCQAVQHAHQKGIIHRDLKPSNVLVASYDGVAIPKVIDFGIAKALGQSLTDQPLFTSFGTIVGTFNYMSPEQATFNAIDVDTRSDIYSLGAILYELLTGSPPLDDRLTPEVGFEALLNVIREEEPIKPSTRLSTAAAAPRPAVSAYRGADQAARGRAVRGDLDWIVMKALAKKRSRRYETATGFARDVDRYLKGEMVEARPPTLGYRAQKFLRRYRGAVIAAGVVGVTLVGGIVGTTSGMMRAEKHRSDAETARNSEHAARVSEQSQKNIALHEKQVAEAAAERAGAFSEILNRSLMVGNPLNVNGSPETMSDLLTNVALEVDGRPDLPADVRGPIDSFVARAMITQGQSTLAATRADQGLQLTLQSLPADSHEVLRAELIAGMAHAVANQLAEAHEHLDKAALLFQKLNPTRSERADYLSVRVMVALGEKNKPAAIQGARELVAMAGEGERSITPGLIVARVMLSVVTAGSVDQQEALRGARDNAADAARTLGPEHGLTLVCDLIHCNALVASGRGGEAAPLLADLIPRFERVYGSDHITVGGAVSLLGMIYANEGRAEEAGKLFQRAREIAEKWAKSPGMGRTELLVMTAAMKGDFAQFGEGLKLLDARSPSTRPVAGFDSQNLIDAFARSLKLLNDEDSVGIENILDPVVNSLPPMERLTDLQQTVSMSCRMLLYYAYTRNGKADRADRECKEWLEGVRGRQGVDSQQFLLALTVRCYVLFALDKPAESLELLDKEFSNLPLVATDLQAKNLFVTLKGIDLALLGREDDAEPLLADGLAGFDRNPLGQLFPQFRTIMVQSLIAIRRHHGDIAGADQIAGHHPVPKPSTNPAAPPTNAEHPPAARK
jgi:serine/threonine protein kinase